MTRLEWILGVLLALLVIIGLAVAGFLIFGPGVGTPPLPPNPSGNVAPTSTFAGGTALEFFYSFALPEAQKWQADAQLINATATLPRGTNRESLITGKANWTFTFYSPTTISIAVIAVTGNQASLIAQRMADKTLELVDLDGWQIDSPQAIDRMLNQGGNDFLQDVDIATLTMAVTMDSPGRSSEWFISLIAPTGGQSFTIRLNGRTGDTLTIQQTP